MWGLVGIPVHGVILATGVSGAILRCVLAVRTVRGWTSGRSGGAGRGRARRRGSRRPLRRRAGRSLLRATGAASPHGRPGPRRDLVQGAPSSGLPHAWPRIEDTGSLDRYTRQTMTRLHVSWVASGRQPRTPGRHTGASRRGGRRGSARAPVEERDEVWRLRHDRAAPTAVLVLRFYEGPGRRGDRRGARLRGRDGAQPGLRAAGPPARPAGRTSVRIDHPAARPTAPGRRTRDDRSRPALVDTFERHADDAPTASGAGLAEVVTRAGGAWSADAASPAPVWRSPRSSSASA